MYQQNYWDNVFAIQNRTAPSIDIIINFNYIQNMQKSVRKGIILLNCNYVEKE